MLASAMDVFGDDVVLHVRTGRCGRTRRCSVSPEMERRLRVDWIKCDGYGLCGDLAPDLVDLDEWRHPILRPAPIRGRSLTTPGGPSTAAR